MKIPSIKKLSEIRTDPRGHVLGKQKALSSRREAAPCRAKQKQPMARDTLESPGSEGSCRHSLRLATDKTLETCWGT